MNADLTGRRREVVAFVLVAIVAGLFVNLFASILMETVYKHHDIWFTIVLSALTIICVPVVYILVLAATERTSTTIHVPAVYDFSRDAFLDIPKSWLSVNARVFWDELNPDVKSKIREECLNRENPWRNPLHCFFDDSIQTALLKSLVGLSEPKVDRTRRREWAIEDLPDGIRDNPITKQMMQRDPTYRMVLPVNVTIESFADATVHHPCLSAETLGDRGRFFRFLSPYGSIEARWSSSILPGGTYDSHQVISITTACCQDAMVEFHTEITLTFRRNFIWMFSHGMARHLAWATSLIEKLEDLDWRKHQFKVILVMLDAIAKKLD